MQALEIPAQPDEASTMMNEFDIAVAIWFLVIVGGTLLLLLSIEG